MSLTPTDDTDSRSVPQSVPESEEGSSSVRSRVALTCYRVQRAGQRAVAGCRRLLGAVAGAVTGRRDRETEGTALADSAVPPPDCPEVDGFPSRAFPLSYPTRSYRVIDNDADLIAEGDGETIRLEHPDAPEAHIESDTWTEIER